MVQKISHNTIKFSQGQWYHQEPQNIYEEYQNHAMERRAKYNAMLKQYVDERVEYLERAEAYIKIVNIFKSLMP